MNRLLSLFIFLSFVILPAISSAKDFHPNGPLIARTQNPVYLMSLGQEPARAVVNKKGRYSFWLNMDYTNMFTLGGTTANQVYLDMELARVSLNLVYGLGRNMEVGLEIPFLHFNGGYFDSWIQAFHNAFGFPNGGRNRYPNGQFVYQITKNGQVVYNPKRMPFGLSDIILNFKYNFVEEEKYLPAMAWRFRFKLPTGSADSGLGSGNVDYSFGFAMEKNISRWHFYLNADYIVASANPNFDGLYNGQILAWMAAVEFSVSRPISIVAQFMGSTPLLSDLPTSKWTGPPVDLTLGIKGTHKDLFWKSDFFWQWGFTEDLNTNGPSPDITTMLIVGVNFGG